MREWWSAVLEMVLRQTVVRLHLRAERVRERRKRRLAAERTRLMALWAPQQDVDEPPGL
jgi:hypothetical protein